MAEGLRNNEIAEQLQMSPSTVRNVLTLVYGAIGRSSRVHLARLVLQGALVVSTQRRGV